MNVARATILLVKFITFVWAVACFKFAPIHKTNAMAQNDPVPGPKKPS